MNKKLRIGIIVGIVLTIGAVVWASRYTAFFVDSPLGSVEPVIVNEVAYEALNNASADAPVEYRLEIVAENLFVPWSIVFTDADRMLVTERNGNIRIIQGGVLQEQPLITFSEISTDEEEGLMGLAKDPDYNNNHYLYVCLAQPRNGQLVDVVMRLTDTGTAVTDETVLLDNIPAAQYHAGCRLQFGPDDKLYITTGDATDKNLAQDLNSLAGKILRINPDGTIPEDNPFSNSPVWTYGHRNPQGIAWHPVTKEMYATEHGPSLFDGPAGGDEVNYIQKGKNYGWPIVSHEVTKPEFESPLLIFTPAVAPASAIFYNADKLPQFKNSLFFGALKGEGIIRVILSENDPKTVIFYERIDIGQIGRIREITQGPDGAIYFSTSNRDGRGEVRTGDDKIYRLYPKKSN